MNTIFGDYTGTIPNNTYNNVKIKVNLGDISYENDGKEGVYISFEIWCNEINNKYYKRKREKDKTDF